MGIRSSSKWKIEFEIIVFMIAKTNQNQTRLQYENLQN